MIRDSKYFGAKSDEWNMRTKPWPIIVLAILYVLGPFFNTFAGALVMPLPYFEYVQALVKHGTWWDLVTVVGLYPLAGFAIFSVKEWSYPVYLIIMAIASWANFQDYRHFSSVFTLQLFIATTVLNVGLVSYFLLPAVRAAYFNKRLRWWESKPRYEIAVPAVLERDGFRTKCTIANISEGGVFLKCGKKLEQNEVVQLQFTVFSRPVDVQGKVVYRLWKGIRGYGVEFIHTDETKQQIIRLTKGLRLMGMQTRSNAPDWKTSFAQWIVNLVTSGRGWVPELPSATLAAKTPGKRLTAVGRNSPEGRGANVYRLKDKRRKPKSAAA